MRLQEIKINPKRMRKENIYSYFLHLGGAQQGSNIRGINRYTGEHPLEAHNRPTLSLTYTQADTRTHTQEHLTQGCTVAFTYALKHCGRRTDRAGQYKTTGMASTVTPLNCTHVLNTLLPSMFPQRSNVYVQSYLKAI